METTADPGQEMRNMADRRETDKSCFGRYPVLCSLLICTLLIISVVVSGLSAGLYLQVVRPAVDNTIAENVVLTRGSAGFPQFMSSSAPLFSYYYMFNITNSKEVQQGTAKPKLTQIGPFVYRENRTKYDPSWEDEEGGDSSQDVLKYSMMINYTLDPARSHALDPKKTFVTNINIPLMGILLELENIEDVESGTKKLFLEEVLKLIDATILSGEGLFITKSVHEFLWGYEDKVLKRIKTLQDDFNKLHVHKPIDIIDQTVFGFGNLSSVETPNRVYTGANDSNIVAEFIEWNGCYDISGWGTESARSINGTGGFMFHPGVTRHENLTAFINEIYRSGYFSYEEDIDLYGIQLYKFVLPRDELKNSSQDSGFNANGPSGVLNLTAVVPSNIPLFASKPHFLDADPDYQTNVSGLSPDRDQHESYLAVEPLTGAVLDAAKRIQVNFRLTNYSHLKQLAKLKPVTMLPVYWVAQTGTITPDLASEFKSVVYMARDGVEGGMWALTGVAGIVAVVCLLCLVGLVIEVMKNKSSLQRGNQRMVNTSYSETSPLLTGNI